MFKKFFKWLAAPADLSKFPENSGTPEDSEGVVFTGKFGDCICNKESKVPHNKLYNVVGIMDATFDADYVMGAVYPKPLFGRPHYINNYYPSWKEYSNHLERRILEYQEKLYLTVCDKRALELKFENEQFDHPERQIKVDRYVCIEAYKVLVEELKREKAALMEEVLDMRKIANKNT